MTRQINPVEVSNFVAGLVTEASPLTFPANASLDEDNFILSRDGARQRRLGMDFEPDHQIINTSVTVPTEGNLATTSTRWNNVGGDPEKNFIAVQIGNQLRVFDASVTPISASVIFAYNFTDVQLDKAFSYAVVDGALVIATGRKPVSVLNYQSGSITLTDKILFIRDQFGVTDIANGVNIREGNAVTIRPSAYLEPHIYNLRNQTWAVPRKIVAVETVFDPIGDFRNKSSLFPSNADNVIHALYPDANDPDDRLSERFNSFDVINSPVGTFPAPKGYFIIDAMARGTSRLTEVQRLNAQYPQLGFSVSSLPADTTPGGPSVVSEYAGRVFYSGFSGEIMGPDQNSPHMSSYVLFSQLVEDPTDITTCYQEGDPTSKETPDLLDTDGGFIRIEGAYNIVRLVNVGNALAVLAANGVWLIQGGSDYGFKATNYMTTKITTHGCDSPNSVIVIDNTFMFWSDDGIYNVAPNQFGDYIAENITQKTIQKFYDAIDGLDRRDCKGTYDTYDKKVRWLYGGRLSGSSQVRELVLDITLGAFYPSTIGFSNGRLPLPITGILVPPFRVVEVDVPVTVNTEPVTASGNLVTTEESVSQSSTRETIYVVVTSINPTINFTFGSYTDRFHRDWRSVDGIGVDAPSFLLTGYQSGGDYQRNKQVPYLTMHFNKTENGFEDDFVPTNPSSCLVQAQWDWANSANSGQWGRTFQAYRFKRHYMPASIDDSYDNGYSTVQTKNKIRGKGKVVSLLFKSEPDKHMNLLGWSMIFGSNSNV